MSSKKKSASHEDARRFFNRDLSWVEFNARVLGEALREEHPLLERLKFLSIVSSNFDEFFMVRVAALRRQLRAQSRGTCPSRLTPAQQYRTITARVRAIVNNQYSCLLESILPRLAGAGLRLVRSTDLSPAQLSGVHEQFESTIFPVLSPVRFTPGEHLPCSGNARLHIGFALEKEKPESGGGCDIGVVQIPPTVHRFCSLPSSHEGEHCFALVEEVIQLNAHRLFPGRTILESASFRLTRDADLSVDEGRDEGFIEAMEDMISGREHSGPVRLEIQTGANRIREHLLTTFAIGETETYDLPSPLDLNPFMGLGSAKEFDSLRDPLWKPQPSFFLAAGEDLWDVLKRRDILLHHPYQSFDPVVEFIARGAVDPQVLAIKMILYRTSGNSPIVRSLIQAAEEGKHVTVLVELKARFDEERNIEWAQRLEKAGAIVVYGIANLKVHAKAALIVRQEAHGMQRYLHLGTGNYNDSTARLYVDMGLMSSREDLTMEATLFFNALTGYSTITPLVRLVMAPTGLKTRIVQLIDREIQRSSKSTRGCIMAKLNSLSDPVVIEALYRASNAGVRVMLNIRGICMLVPGVSRQSENITVVSIIDRYLEHTRIVYTRNGGSEEVYLSSADWMVRNLEKRVELLFPVEQRDLKTRIIRVLELYFDDTTHSHQLTSDGSYARRVPEGKRRGVRAQERLYLDACTRSEAAQTTSAHTLKVRKTPVSRAKPHP